MAHVLFDGMAADIAPLHHPSLQAAMNRPFFDFLEQMSKHAPKMEYGWDHWKEESAMWLVNRIAPGKKGVDVGGTEWLCRELTKRGIDVTFYDMFPPKSFEPFIADDMFNVKYHFEEKSLDFITTRHTLEHSLVPMFQLWCYNKILKDDGRLFVIVPQHTREWVWFGTHHSPLPRENWLMLFYRMGFKVVASDAGTWKPSGSQFIEYRFELAVESREPRLGFYPPWLPF